MTPTPSEMAFDPYKILSWRHKKICPERKFSPAYAGTSSWPKRAKTAIIFLAWDPPWPPAVLIFYDPPLAKKIFWPPLEMTTLLTYGFRLHNFSDSFLLISLHFRTSFSGKLFTSKQRTYFFDSFFAMDDFQGNRHSETEKINAATRDRTRDL